MLRLEDIKNHTAITGVEPGFWFDTRPNLPREMEERKRRFQDKEDVLLAKGRLQRTVLQES